MMKPRPSGPRNEAPILLLMVLLGLAAVFLLVRPAAAALTCDRSSCGPFLQGSVGHTTIVCFFPASPVAQELWGELQPVDPSPLPAERDTTAFNEFDTSGAAGLYYRNNWFMGVDVENGWVLAGLAHGIGIWDARTTPANPTFKIERKYDPSPVGGFPYIPGGEFSKFVFGAIDAPDDTIAAVVGYNGAGILVFDLTNKDDPKPVYQNAGLDSSESVWAATIGGTRYAFVAAKSSGLKVYNLDRARTFTDGCGEGGEFSSSCPGVKLAGITLAGGTADFVHGAGNFLAVSGGGKVQIFDVSNPSSPVSRLVASVTAKGLALWNQGASYYLAARVSGSQTAIYDVSCINGGTCSGLGNSLWSGPTDTQSSQEYLTFSRSSGGTPFIYIGGDAPCVGSLDTRQHEWLFDVSNPSAPHDVSPQGTILKTATYNDVQKAMPVGYWSWYYRPSPTGFDYVSPRAGKFSGDYFFRAAKSIFDIHKLARNSPPVADFDWSPTDVYPGTPVTFSDRSSGAPIQWSWTFPDGTPGTATTQNPQVAFASVGSKAVALSSFNNVGRGDASKNITVLDPKPVIGQLSASPASPTVCQPVTLSASGVLGQPALFYDWKIDTVHLSNSTAPVWDTTNVGPGNHTVSLDLTNTSGAANKSIIVNVAALSPLPSGGGFTPTNDPFTDGTVHFHVTASGATEWRWDFGDGAGFGNWTNDPASGPNPVHVYTSIGNKTVKVQVRNCQNLGGVESAALTINILQTTPLVASFQAGVFCQFGACFASANQALPFTDSSTGAEHWDYDWTNTNAAGPCSFTDNDHTTPVTSHTYTAAGDVYPCLQVRRGTEVSTTFVHAKITIDAGAPPSVAVGGPSSGSINTGLTFTASASNCTASATGWSWNTGGGTGSSTTSSITITWASAGGKSVSATNSGCGSAQGVKSLTITDPNGGGGGGGNLQASFTYTPAPQPNQVVNFDGSSSTGSPTDWRWDFGDNTTGTGQSVTHTFTSAGNYSVKLSVSKPAVGCPFAPCVSESSTTKVVTVGTVEPPPSAEFTANVDCINVGGFDQCQAKTGQAVVLTANAADATTYNWSFGDNTTGSGRSATHNWSQPGNYAVTLTVTKGQATASKSRTFIIGGSPVAKTKSVVLPWIAQTRGALLQSSDLYVNNPGTSAVDVTLEFRKRGTPETNPPRVTRTIQAGATLYVADVLRELFNRENVAGFISVSVQSDVEPIITSFNTTFQPDGKQFGQTVAGVPMNATDSAAASSAGDQVQHLVGLNDNSDRLAYFGISNPSDGPATYHLRFFDKTGRQIGDSIQDLTLSRFGQRQFQTKEIHDDFGISNADDYRIEIETKSGGQIIPYASNLRLSSEDPSFVEAGASRAAKVYLVGVLSTPGLNNSLWQTDVLLSNVGDQQVAADLTFTSVGNTSTPTSPLHLTLTSGQTERLANVIAGQWGIKNAIGVVTIASTGDFPIVQGESYENTNPANRFGQTMAAVSDADAAAAGQSQFLVGLRQDANNRTTFWIFNPGTDTAEYDVIYRDLDGKALGTTAGVRLGAGKLRQFSPSQHPLPAAGVLNGFTVQIVVKSGTVLSAAQVINNLTNDPAYIKGEVR